jgi:hypothetical protein
MRKLLILLLFPLLVQAEITTDIPSEVIKGQPFILGFTVFNEALPITNAVFTYGIPSSFQIDEATITQGTCTVDSTVRCTLGTISTGISITLKVTPLEVSNISGVASIKGNTKDCTSCDVKSYFKSKTLSVIVKEPDTQDIIVGFKNPSYIVSEGNTLNIETINNTDIPIELSYYISSGNADTSDYELVLGTIIDGDIIRIKILEDGQDEKDETLTLTLITSNPDVKLQPNSTKITIVNSSVAHALNATQHIKDKGYTKLGTLGIETANWQINSIRNRLNSLRLGKRKAFSAKLDVDNKSLPTVEYDFMKPSKFGFFADTYFGTGDVSGNGFSLGFDYGRNGKFIGLALGGNNSSDDDIEFSSTNITVFGNHQEGQFYLEFLLGYGETDFDIGNHAGQGRQQIFKAGMGYDVNLNPFVFTPHLSLQNVIIDNDGFSDSVLNISSQKAVSTIFEVGVRTQLIAHFNNFDLIPWIDTNYYLDNRYQEITGSYVNFDERFNFRDDQKENNISFELGLTAQFDIGNVGLSYKQDEVSDSIYLNIFVSF